MPTGFARRDPAFSNVLYPTKAETDRWFIPTTGFGDNPNAGTTAQQLAQCKEMLGEDHCNSPATQIGKAVKDNTLADW